MTQQTKWLVTVELDAYDAEGAMRQIQYDLMQGDGSGKVVSVNPK